MGSSPFLPGTHRALVVLRFLLNATEETDRIWPNPKPLYYLTNYIHSAETRDVRAKGISVANCRMLRRSQLPDRTRSATASTMHVVGGLAEAAPCRIDLDYPIVGGGKVR